MQPKQFPLIIEVPHPVADWFTDPQAVTIFRQSRARALLVAGTHRCANSDFSTCTGQTWACGPLEAYRVSDVGSHRAEHVPGHPPRPVAVRWDHDHAPATCQQPGKLPGPVYQQRHAVPRGAQPGFVSGCVFNLRRFHSGYLPMAWD